MKSKNVLFSQRTESIFERVSESKMKKLIKSISSSLNSEHNISSELIEGIVQSQCEKINIDAYDILNFFEFSFRKFYQQLKSLLSNNSKFDINSKDTVIAYLSSYYDFYEDELVISTDYIVKTITNSNVGDSFIISLNKILLYAKYNEDIMRFVFRKDNDIFDIGIKLMKAIELFNQIQNSSHINDKSIALYISKCVSYSLPYLLDLFIDVLTYNDKATMLLIISKDSNAILFNCLSSYKKIRSGIFSIFAKANVLFDDDHRSKFIDYITRNKCIDGIITSIKNSYISSADPIIMNDVIKEIRHVMLLQLILSDDFDDSNIIFQLLLVIFDKVSDVATESKEISKFLDEIFKISFIDQSEMKLRCKDKVFSDIDIDDVIQSKGTEVNSFIVINFFLDLFVINKSMRNIISSVFLDNINNNIEIYKSIIDNTDFIEKVIGNLYQCDENTISSFFIFLFSFVFNDNSVYRPIRELNTMITSIKKCDDHMQIAQIVNNLKKFSEMNNENIDDVYRTFIDVVYSVINDIANSDNDNPFGGMIRSDDANVFSEAMIVPLLSFTKTILSSSAKMYEYFKRQKFLSFFMSLVDKREYVFIAYEIVKIMIDNESEVDDIVALLNFVFSRSEEKEKIDDDDIVNVLSERNYMNSVFKVVIEKEGVVCLLSQTEKEKIIFCIFSFGEFLSHFAIKEKILSSWNYQYQDIIKANVDFINDIVYVHNKNILQNERYSDDVIVSEKNVKKAISSLILFLSYIDRKEFLIDMIKHLIDTSLKFKKISNDINTSEDKLLKSDFSLFYINKHTISSDNLNFFTMTSSLISNFNIQSAMMLMITLKSLIKIDKYIDVFLSFIEFILKLNDENVRMLLSKGLTKTLIKIINTKKEIEILDIAVRIIKRTILFESKSNFIMIFDYIISSLKHDENEIVNKFKSELINAMSSSLTKATKISNGISLSYLNSRQLNVYNMIFTTGLNLSYKTISIFQSLKFISSSIDLTKFILFRIESATSYIEVYIENEGLFVKENDIITSSSSKNISYVLTANKTSTFISEINNQEMTLEVTINGVLFHESKIRNSTMSIDSTVIVGYIGSAIRDVYNDTFAVLPHVKVNYMMIYSDKISNELSHLINYTKIKTSKNGSIHTDKINIKYLTKQNYQRISSILLNNLNEGNEKKKNISVINVDNDTRCKILFEIVNDKRSIVALRKFYCKAPLKNDLAFLNKINNDVQIKFGITLSNKEFLECVNNTNCSNFSYKNTNNVINDNFSHSYLISKYNIIESLCVNNVLTSSSMIQLHNVSYIDMIFNDINIVKYIIAALSEVSFISSSLSRGEIFFSLIKLLCVYLNINISKLEAVAYDDKILSSLSFAIAKNSDIITEDIIELIFFLAFSFPFYIDLRTKNILNKSLPLQLISPFFPSLIFDVLLNDVVFEAIHIDAKHRLISMIKQYIITNDCCVFSYSLKAKLTKRFVMIVLTVDNDKAIDDEIINSLLIIVEQVLKPKPGAPMPNDNDINIVVDSIAMLIAILCKFDDVVRDHIETKNKGQRIKTEQIINDIFQKIIYGDLTKNYKDMMYTRLMTMSLSEGVNREIRRASVIEKKEENKFRSRPSRSFHKKSIVDDNVEESVYVHTEENNDDTVKASTKSLRYNNKTMTTWVNVNSNKVNNALIIRSDDENICIGNCRICRFIREVIKRKLKNEIEISIVKEYIDDIMKDVYVSSCNFIRERFDLGFSFFLSFSEGPMRMRKRFVVARDIIKNNEIDRSNINNANSITKSSNDFVSQLSKRNKKIIFNLDHIFDVNIVKNINETEEDMDDYQCAYNSLLFKGMTYVNCVLILTKNKINILTNVNIDKDNCIHLCKKPFMKVFWTLNENDSDIILNEQCKYLSYEYEDEEQLQQEMNDDEKEAECNRINVKELFSRYHHSIKLISFTYSEINEIHKRKFLHHENSFEIFIKNGTSYFIAVNEFNRDKVISNIIRNITTYFPLRKHMLYSKSSVCNINYPDITFSSNDIKKNTMIYLSNKNIFIRSSRTSLSSFNPIITDAKTLLDDFIDKWTIGIISNFSYLMFLNTISNRTYNDLSQYPIMPWIIGDYTSEIINLTSPESYRDFSYPIYAQAASLREQLQLKYESAEDEFMQYHCGSHYSTPGFIGYFLVRVKPFSLIAAEIQGGCFDTPDRLFFNIKNMYDVNDKYQELIPEMFTLPEMFVNVNQYVYGKTQGGDIVDDVALPQWAMKDVRLFSMMGMKAIESANVSEKINDWIDLVFGYKQKGNEAIESCNVMRGVCYQFDTDKLITERKKENNSDELTKDILEELELKINEICDMGLNANILFNKAHPRKERHQRAIAFFGRSVYLMNFKAKEKEFKVKIDNKVNDIKAYYENDIGAHVSNGEGGVSSFRMIYEDNIADPNNKNETMKNIVYFIAGEKKVLIPPSYKNYIDWSRNKNSIYIVKPYKRAVFEFCLREDTAITFVTVTRDKMIYVGFHNGKINKYKMKKCKYDIVEKEPEAKKEGKKEKKNFIGKLFHKKKRKESDSTSVNTITEDVHDIQNEILFNDEISICDSNISNTDTFYSKDVTNFTQLSPNSFFIPSSECDPLFRDYAAHCVSSHEMKSILKLDDKSKKKSIHCKKPYLFLINSSSFITSSICDVKINSSFRQLIALSSENKIYIGDSASLTFSNVVDISHITKHKIIHIAISETNGDFVISTKTSMMLFNINGVFLSFIDINSFKISSYITHIIIKSTRTNDINIFTSHSDGNVIIWKIESVLIDKSTANYISNFTKKKNQTRLNCTLRFDLVMRIKATSRSIAQMKITEDMTKMIVISNDGTIVYLSYEDFLEKKKKSKQLKTCPNCLSAISSSKILCHICNKKLCSKCKIEEKIPEFSLKNRKAICEDCKSLIMSTNKMLYDF